MNLRTLKKHCQRAKAILIAEHGYGETDFKPADGSETFYAPPTLEKRQHRTPIGMQSPHPKQRKGAAGHTQRPPTINTSGLVFCSVISYLGQESTDRTVSCTTAPCRLGKHPDGPAILRKVTGQDHHSWL